MTAKPVEFVLDELGAVVDAQPATHPLRRVDRDNSLLYEGGGTFEMRGATKQRTAELKRSNIVGAAFADREGTYIGTAPNLDLEEVVGIRIEGYGGDYGHIGPRGEDGVVFHGTDGALVEQIRAALYDALRFPDAGRTNVGFTHLTITNETPAMADWQDHYRFDLDIAFDGFETL
jgi:hypothetical protein